jgi:hypothetical protein
MRWILACLTLTTAIAATPLLQSTFDNDPGAWTVMGGNGTLRVTRDGANQRDGKPSLAFEYEIGPKKFGAAILPVEPGALATMDQIHFWIKTDYATSIAVILSERGGGNYSALAWSPGGAWQEVQFAPRDFTLGERPNDPPDPDGKLDTDQVQGVGITDLGQLFGAAPANSDMPIALDRHPGKHTLLINGFDALAGAAADPKDKLVIDPFVTPQFSWVSPGGATFRLDSSNEHSPAAAMEVSYPSDKGVVYIARSLPQEIPANISHISFDIASAHPVQLVFALQLKSSGRGEGPRYNTTVEVKGGGKSDHRDLALSAFTLDQNGPPDPGNGLKIEKAKNFSIVDISAATGDAHGPNKIWISNLRLTGNN